MKSRAAAVLAIAASVAVAPHPAEAQLPLPTTFAAPARIAFNADAEIYTIGADGSDRRHLAKGGLPAWAPDGGSIAFVRDLSTPSPEGDDEDEKLQSQIWVMRPDGSDQRPFAPPSPKDAFDSSPTWSPDGRIAFVRTRYASNGIVSSLIVTGPDGAGARTLVRETAKTLAFIGSPGWSPDGSTILYTRVVLGRNAYFRPALHAIGAEGGTPRRLAKDAADGAWAPDGGRIAFTSVRDRNGERCGSDECSYAGELYVMNADGTGRVRLTTGKGDEQAPSWSADGERIAFHSDRNYPDGENPELYSIKPDGSCMTWLSNGTADSAYPDWEPGAQLPTDPGSCGATPRDPLIDTDATEATSFRRVPVYWLGTSTASGLLLSYVDASGGDVIVDYDDCARYEPTDCPPSILLNNQSSCGSHPLFHAGYEPERVTRVGGGGLLYRPADPEAIPDLYAGPTTVTLQIEGAPGPVVAALRQANGESQPGEFPLARFPLGFWRRIDRATAARRKYGTKRAAERLKMARGVLKERVAIGRRLRELGQFGRFDCSR